MRKDVEIFDDKENKQIIRTESYAFNRSYLLIWFFCLIILSVFLVLFDYRGSRYFAIVTFSFAIFSLIARNKFKE